MGPNSEQMLSNNKFSHPPISRRERERHYMNHDDQNTPYFPLTVSQRKKERHHLSQLFHQCHWSIPEYQMTVAKSCRRQARRMAKWHLLSKGSTKSIYLRNDPKCDLNLQQMLSNNKLPSSYFTQRLNFIVKLEPVLLYSAENQIRDLKNHCHEDAFRAESTESGARRYILNERDENGAFDHLL